MCDVYVYVMCVDAYGCVWVCGGVSVRVCICVDLYGCVWIIMIGSNNDMTLYGYDCVIFMCM